jgi:hypothetical protein
MAKISKDLSVGTLHPRENLYAAGSLAAANAELVLACDGASTFSLDLRGIYNLNIELSGSVDGVNWVPIVVRALNVATLNYQALITNPAPGIYVGKCASFRLIRVRVPSYTSGSAAAFLMASVAQLDDSLVAELTPLVVTATGAAGAAVTLTIPATGQALRPYLTSLFISRFAATALTASATPVVITTTNLPGALAFTAPADGVALGVVTPIVDQNFGFPIATSAQNTATTIVLPATPGVIWRATVGYYLAP